MLGFFKSNRNSPSSVSQKDCEASLLETRDFLPSFLLKIGKRLIPMQLLKSSIIINLLKKAEFHKPSRLRYSAFAAPLPRRGAEGEAVTIPAFYERTYIIKICKMA